MLRVAVDAVAPGAILARTLYTTTGQPVLRAGHPLNDSVLRRLPSFGIRFVWLDEPDLAGLAPEEPLSQVTFLLAVGALIRAATAAAGGETRLPATLRSQLADVAARIADELEPAPSLPGWKGSGKESSGTHTPGAEWHGGPGAGGTGAVPMPREHGASPTAPVDPAAPALTAALPYPLAGGGPEAWAITVLNRAILAGRLALAGPYRGQVRDFVLAALLQDAGLWRMPGAPYRCDPVAALDGTLGTPPGRHGGTPGGGAASPAGPGGPGRLTGRGQATGHDDAIPQGGAVVPRPTATGSRTPDQSGAAPHAGTAGHVALTLDWLSGVELGGLVRALIAQHHEQLDGGGYPEGLRDDAFHPAARRLAAVTAYTLAVQGCPHRSGWLPHEAYEWLLAEGPRLWGADVVDELAAILYPYPPGTLIQLDGGPWAVVTGCTGARRLRPRVRLLPARWQPEPAAREAAAGEAVVDLLEQRTRQITAWAVAWPATAADAPAPAGKGR
ncbi:phosphohydrolase [Thermaerobacter sp. PB12/4term]|uniref:HD-GYP domain-containing protein n=1 Tax=Thermaerobacter sp. PB12/4term TaxID=2293838 RepID=UPI000E32719A|nr:HD domain-containing phosphohydrolase [Thermaerobacter sp. PB12/4term]QIA27868.1 phosphohydrolase [Thermaerobacter sp. PB12/4term]